MAHYKVCYFCDAVNNIAVNEGFHCDFCNTFYCDVTCGVIYENFQNKTYKCRKCSGNWLNSEDIVKKCAELLGHSTVMSLRHTILYGGK